MRDIHRDLLPPGALLLAIAGVLLFAGCVRSVESVCVADTDADLRKWAQQGDLKCYLAVDNTDAITSLDAGLGIQTLFGLWAVEMPNLVDVDLIETFTGPFELLLEGAPLSPLLLVPANAEFVRIRRTGVVTVHFAEDFSSGIGLGENDALQTIDFGGVDRFSGISVRASPALAGWTGLENLTSCDDVHIREAPLIGMDAIRALAAKCGLDESEVVHCGNLDDDPCPPNQ